MQAATLRVELLLWLARGAEGWDASRKGEMPTDDLGGYAVDLLDHADPFVRGVAEWAIATRLGMDYECAESTVQGMRIAQDWPGTGAPSWYQRWAAIGPEAALELDYVRQAVAVGSHRTTAGLLKSGEVLVERAGDLRAHLEKQGVAQAADVEARYAQVKAAFEKLPRLGGLGGWEGGNGWISRDCVQRSALQAR